MNPKLLSINRMPSKRHQKGSMLISVLFMIVVLGGLMAAISTLSNQSSQQLVYEVQALKARLVAESGLEQQMYASLANIGADAVYKESTPYTDDLGCGAYIRPLSPQLIPLPKRVNIVATGQCSTGQLTVVRNREVEVINNEN